MRMKKISAGKRVEGCGLIIRVLAEGYRQEIMVRPGWIRPQVRCRKKTRPECAAGSGSGNGPFNNQDKHSTLRIHGALFFAKKP